MESAKESGLGSGTRSPEHGEPAGEASPEPITVIVLAKQEPDPYVQAWIRQVHGPNTTTVTETRTYGRALNSPRGLVHAVNDQTKRGPVYVSQQTPALQMGELAGYTSLVGDTMYYGIYHEISDSGTPEQEYRLAGLWHIRGTRTSRVLKGTYTTVGQLINDPLF